MSTITITHLERVVTITVTRVAGPRGLSAYQVAVINGYPGSEEQWLTSLIGESAYEYAVRVDGFTGTEVEYYAQIGDAIVQTGLAVIATAADRIQTGEDRTATIQHAISTAQDRIATGSDAEQTAEDVIATAADRIATGSDRSQTGLDKIATAADRIATGEDKAQTALDRIATAADLLATGSDRTQTGLDRIATAADRIATGQDRTQTGLDRTQTGLDRTQTGQDKIATAADRVQTGLDVVSAAASALAASASVNSLEYKHKFLDDLTLQATGDDQTIITVTESLAGKYLVSAHASVTTASTSGTPTYQLRNKTQANADMLSTRITIDLNAYNSYTATVPPVVDATKRLLTLGDRIAIDCDVAGNLTKGTEIILKVANS